MYSEMLRKIKELGGYSSEGVAEKITNMLDNGEVITYQQIDSYIKRKYFPKSKTRIAIEKLAKEEGIYVPPTEYELGGMMKELEMLRERVDRYDQDIKRVLMECTTAVRDAGFSHSGKH